METVPWLLNPVKGDAKFRWRFLTVHAPQSGRPAEVENDQIENNQCYTT